MNRKFFIGWVIVFVAWFAGSYLVHGTLLHGDYAQIPSLMRTETDMMQYFHWMVVAHVLMSGAFVWIYARGVEAKPWFAQGLRFGFAVALLAIVPTYLIYYVVQPMPSTLVVKQIAFDGALVLIVGVIVAFVYRQPEAYAQAAAKAA